jgi:hypothetical protein
VEAKTVSDFPEIGKPLLDLLISKYNVQFQRINNLKKLKSLYELKFIVEDLF